MNDEWTKPAKFPVFEEGEIHIWRIPLVVGEYRPLMELLSEDEVRRGERFLFEKHREHYVVGRARMRRLLAAYTNNTARNVEFAYENLGKPKFADAILHARFQFNFSNSSDRGLLAITRGRKVGVDLERVRSMKDRMQLARRYFAESEIQKLFALPEKQQSDAFFRCWTRKEAYLKAVGKGLTFPLRNVEVTLLENEPCRLLHINSSKEDASAWSLVSLRPFDGYLGALATPHGVDDFRLFDWSDRWVP